MACLVSCGLLARHPLLHAAYMRVRNLAAMLGLEAGDELEFDHIGDGTLRLRKA